MNKICTDIEQSKKLIELGLDVSTADMLWTYDFTVNGINGLNVISNYLKPEEKDVPAWSLAALLDVLPKGKVLIDDVHSNKYKIIGYNLDTDYYDEPLDACYEMVLKLREQKLL